MLQVTLTFSFRFIVEAALCLFTSCRSNLVTSPSVALGRIIIRVSVTFLVEMEHNDQSDASYGTTSYGVRCINGSTLQGSKQRVCASPFVMCRDFLLVTSTRRVRGNQQSKRRIPPPGDYNGLGKVVRRVRNNRQRWKTRRCQTRRMKAREERKPSTNKTLPLVVGRDMEERSSYLRSSVIRRNSLTRALSAAEHLLCFDNDRWIRRRHLSHHERMVSEQLTIECAAARSSSTPMHSES